MLEWIANHPWIISFALVVGIPLILFQLLPLLVLIERRGAGFIQDRAGPNRAGLNLQLKSLAGVFSDRRDLGGLRLRAFGALYSLADLVKLLFKENFIPPFAHKGYYLVAPAIPVVIGLLTTALIPWFAPIAVIGTAGTTMLSGQLIDSNSGLLMLFALSSLSVYGVVLGAWSSNSKYSLLGGMRASAMMISYEVSMGLSVLGMLLIVGSFSLTDVVGWQDAHTWGVFVQPVGFVLFLVSMFAECNRNPFDVAEGESEIVAGFHTEYNGVRFMLFMTGEYLHMLVASALIATIYFGGYSLLPFPVPVGAGNDGLVWIDLDGSWIRHHIGQVAGGMMILGALPPILLAVLVLGRRTAYAKGDAIDRASRLREYGVYAGLFSLVGIALVVTGILVLLNWRPDPAGVGANVATAVVQFHILLAKTLFFCWIFVWVRWTLPRFRYDQIMGLGWKVMLNIALVNLLVTAIVTKLVK